MGTFGTILVILVDEQLSPQNYTKTYDKLDDSHDECDQQHIRHHNHHRTHSVHQHRYFQFFRHDRQRCSIQNFHQFTETLRRTDSHQSLETDDGDYDFKQTHST